MSSTTRWSHQSPITNPHYCIGRIHSPPPTCRYSYSHRYLCLFGCHHYRLIQPCRSENSPTNHYLTIPKIVSNLGIASLTNIIIVETKEEPHKIPTFQTRQCPWQPNITIIGWNGRFTEQLVKSNDYAANDMELLLGSCLPVRVVWWIRRSMMDTA